MINIDIGHYSQSIETLRDFLFVTPKRRTINIDKVYAAAFGNCSKIRHVTYYIYVSDGMRMHIFAKTESQRGGEKRKHFLCIG